jgi:dipeptidyl-peptidase-4
MSPVGASVPGDGWFPRQHARTRGFTLGQPRDFSVSADGSRVAFLRSAAGDDPELKLWVLDLASGAERLAADPAELDGGAAVPAAERARRERTRERSSGIVAYATDEEGAVAAFALGGRVYLADLAAGGVRELAAGPATDPRPDPSGGLVAYVAGGGLHVTAARAGGRPGRALAAPAEPDVTVGLAEFIAAEEMGRVRGYWWAPDGGRLAAARVDARQVRCWHLADPSDPAAVPAVLRYPAAGTPNADVGLLVLDLDGHAVEVVWDRERLPYLAQVRWDAGAPLTLVVQARDQRELRVLVADAGSGATRTVWTDRDRAWVELVPGVPRWLPDGRLLTAGARGGACRLLVDGEPVTQDGLQVRRVLAASDQGGIVFTASEEPTEVHLYRLRLGGGAPERLTAEAGVHDAVVRGEVLVMTSGRLGGGPVTCVHRPGRAAVPVASRAETPVVRPRPRLLRTGARALRSALLLPSDPGRGRGPLPVLLDPYGGPHAQRVLATAAAFWTPQWFADQGFAVLVTDGRGTPGRGPAWERAVRSDLAGPVLEDQVAALEAVAAEHPELDLTRVAIRGWSFGGYLAALAVLRRGDLFAAAIAGAPVTDWRLYDTHYTERYLGDPVRDADAYERSSLLADAAALRRPLLLIHGLADDNVVAAHTLRLSSALFAAGRQHTVLPLPGVTHVTAQQAVAENLLVLQLEFLRSALGLPGGPG